MALYWPDQKVALQIDDDPASKPFEGPADWQVFHASTAMMDDFDSFDALMNRLAEALGEPRPDPRFRNERRELFQALSRIDARAGTAHPDDPQAILDLKTGDIDEWTDSVPEGSFELMPTGVRMSTPEFFYLREARKRTLLQETQLAYELCGYYGTDHLEDPRIYRVCSQPVTDLRDLRTYLGGARKLDGYKRAMKALNHVAEGSMSPAASYLSILLSAPRNLGCYDLMRPKLGLCVVDALEEERAPTVEGRYEAYDLCWPHQHVAMQFVGDSMPSARERRSLEAPGLADMYVICITSKQMADPEAFDIAARLLAERLNSPLPPNDPAFLEARDKAREELTFPDFDYMRTMVEDWHWHEDA